MAATSNRIRIIGGQWRRSIVAFPPVAGLRPSPDRVRETLFNWLGQDLTGWESLDLFTGSGALALEALSRGASLAVAVDRNMRLIQALKASAIRLSAAGLETHCADAARFLITESRLFDIVFLDPPFDDDPAPIISKAAQRVAPDAFLYVETGRPIDPPSGFEMFRQDKAGRVHYHLLRRLT